MADQEKGFILITGSCGRIGFRCAQWLVKKYLVVGIDVYAGEPLAGMEVVIADIGSPKDLDEKLEKIKAKFGQKISSVIHLAAYYSFTKGHWDEYERVA